MYDFIIPLTVGLPETVIRPEYRQFIHGPFNIHGFKNPISYFDNIPEKTIIFDK